LRSNHGYLELLLLLLLLLAQVPALALPGLPARRAMPRPVAQVGASVVDVHGGDARQGNLRGGFWVGGAERGRLGGAAGGPLTGAP
jgi:hypothetical protein